MHVDTSSMVFILKIWHVCTVYVILCEYVVLRSAPAAAMLLFKLLTPILTSTVSSEM